MTSLVEAYTRSQSIKKRKIFERLFIFYYCSEEDAT